jgi:DNA-binding transcriptional LysR family regulator
MDRGDLANLTAFVAVADRLSFRAAASHLGVTPSALSHLMRQLEERLGVFQLPTIPDAFEGYFWR